MGHPPGIAVFDGTCYQLIGAATRGTDENGAEKIISQPVSAVAGCKVDNARNDRDKMKGIGEKAPPSKNESGAP
jgi:hypothetical protein